MEIRSLDMESWISRKEISFHFILNSLYKVKSTITIDLQAALLKT